MMIYHLLANLAIFPTTSGLAGLFYIVFAILIMFAILVIFGPLTLVRGRRVLIEES